MWIVLTVLLLGCPERRAEPPESVVAVQVPEESEEAVLDETAYPPRSGGEAPEPRAEPDDDDLEAYRPPRDLIRAVSVEIDDSTGEAMAHFNRRLLAVARRDDDALVRISVYAVSTNASDWVTSALRHSLQERYGDGGKGFVPITKGWGAQEHQDVEWSFRGWQPHIVNSGEAPWGRYGLGGVLATNLGFRSRASFGTVSDGPSNRTLTRFRLFYQGWPEGGDVEVRVDGSSLDVLSTRAEAPVDRVFDARLSSGPHEVELRSSEGQLRLYGVTLENDGPGVVVDGLMLLGISTRQLGNFDLDHLGVQMGLRETDLMIFWLGGPDAMRTGFSHDGFVEGYGRAIEAARRGRPEASCLIVSTLDKAYEANGRIRSRRRVREVVAAQEIVARAQGCAFYDLYTATGGEGTLARWQGDHPRLVAPDLTHLTLAGARHVASLLEAALLQGFDDFLISE